MKVGLEMVRRIYLFATVIALIMPILAVEMPPLTDLPNHLSRIYILINYETIPFFQSHFDIVIQPIPNLAQDIIVGALGQVFDIWTANRIFLLICVILFATGCQLVANPNYEGSQISLAGMHASFLIYGWIFLYGLVNYCFGISLFFITYGLWRRWSSALNVNRALVLTLLAFGVYISHLSAIAMMGIAVLLTRCYEFATKEAKFSSPRIAIDLSMFILPSVAFLAFVRGDGNVGVVSWDFLEKLLALPGPFKSYDLWMDALCVCSAVLIYSWCAFRGNLVFNNKTLFVGISFLFVFLIAPLNFFTGDADKRALLPGFVFVLCSINMRSLTRPVKILVGLLFCLLISRQAIIAHRWVQISQMVDSEREKLKILPPNSKIYPLFNIDPARPIPKLERPLRYVVNLVAIDDHSFSANLWALEGENLLRFKSPTEWADIGHIEAGKWLELYRDYDYVWSYDMPSVVDEELEKSGHLVLGSGKTKIWKVNVYHTK